MITTIITATSLGSLIGFLLIAANAPLGFETDEGFFYGKQPFTPPQTQPRAQHLSDQRRNEKAGNIIHADTATAGEGE